MRKGSVYQRHTRKCPRGSDGLVVDHKCRGPWTYSFVAVRWANGKRRQVTRSGYATKRQAEGGLQEALAREEAGVADAHGLTVSQYLQQWLISKLSIRPTTRAGYAFDIERYVAPTIGSGRLSDLRPHHVERLYSDLIHDRTRPATPSTIRHLHTTLRSALNSAVKRRLIPWNPALHVELPEEPRRPTTVWTPDEVRGFLHGISDHRLRTLFRLIAVAGLRRGEALGLHWADVDLDGAAFTVRWQLVNAGRGAATFGPPKTRTGARVIPLDAGTVASLRLHRSEQLSERAAWGDAWTDTGLVFTREDGTPLRPDYVSHLFGRLIAVHDMPPMRLHDLRHTNASLALAAGIPLKVVSQRLGHSTTAITSDLYTHVIPTVGRAAAERLAELIGDLSHSPQQADGGRASFERPSRKPFPTSPET